MSQQNPAAVREETASEITSLWPNALNSLKDGHKKRLKFVRDAGSVDPDAILELVDNQKQRCQEVGKFLDEVSKSLVEYKKTAGGLAQIDSTTHASIPLKVVEVLLKITINDRKTFGSMVLGIEKVSSVIAECTELEVAAKEPAHLESLLQQLYQAWKQSSVIHWLTRTK
ncbi:hypothetical protein GGX14DRAFT_2813 [Mycena pura]|uniref:Uncharacterized protein n=1 Tax=Mycena pura TaxID=153505 RepID=A0AAD6YUV4_9AGAR|nr:hypothetical protein GGX14DRAFT_2813 [Mycena pura]